MTADPAVSHARPPRSRGRPSKAREPQIDRDILHVARNMFAEQGYRRTSIEGVIAKAGIAKRTFYSRYPDKTALYKAVLVQVILETVPAPPEQFDGPADCLRFHLRNFFIFSRDRDAQRLIEGFHQPAEQSRELWQAGHEVQFDHGVAFIAGSLDLSAEQAGVKIGDPLFMASAMIDLAIGYWSRVRHLAEDRLDQTIAMFIDQTVALLIDGGLER